MKLIDSLTSNDLTVIRTWGMLGYPPTLCLSEFFDYLKRIWWRSQCKREYYQDFCQDEWTVITIRTGNWSGNGQIIKTIRENELIWEHCWQASTSAGRYVFKYRTEK